MKALVNGKQVCVGNSKMMDAVGAKWHECSQQAQGTVIHVAINGEYVGHIVISDQLKLDTQAAISELKAVGVRRIVMLTGDHYAVAEYDPSIPHLPLQ